MGCENRQLCLTQLTVLNCADIRWSTVSGEHPPDKMDAGAQDPGR